MRATLVFNNMNDLVFWRWDPLFVKHVLHLARVQGLIPARNDNDAEDSVSEINPDIVIQIFSPVIASQRIMSCQFGNSYSSVQSRDGTNVVFDEYVGYLFIHIGKDSICWMQKYIGICISVVKYFCGPDVSLLKQERQKSGVSMVLNSWERLCFRDQGTLVGASEYIIAGSQAMSASLAALKAVVAALPPPTTTAHTAIFVQNKLLSLYSTRGADDLSPADNIFFGIMSAAAQDKWSRKPPGISSSRSPSPTDDDGDVEHPFDGDDFGETLSWTVLLGNSSPHALHLHRLSKNITLVIAIALGNNAAGNVANALHALIAATSSLAQRDSEALKQAFTPLDIAMKKALDSLKKNKSQPESPQKKLQSQWDMVRRRFTEFLREGTGSWPNLESAVSSLTVKLKTSFHLACRGFAPADIQMRPISTQAHTKLTPLYQFLRARAIGSFTLGSYTSPEMSKYIEEFPGLVHFLYINRGLHRLIAPTLPNCSHMLSRKKIWTMVERTRANLREGHLSSMWKDGALHYAHLVWFEDTTGAPAKPKPLTLPMLCSLPPPNIFPQDYYAKLTEMLFPHNFRSIRCYELIAIHIGLLPAGTALAHVRRLAATVGDITAPTHPVNLL